MSKLKILFSFSSFCRSERKCFSLGNGLFQGNVLSILQLLQGSYWLPTLPSCTAITLMIDLKLYKPLASMQSVPKKSYCMRVAILKSEWEWISHVRKQNKQKLTCIFTELTASTFEIVRYLRNSLSWPIWSIFIAHPSNLTVKCRIKDMRWVRKKLIWIWNRQGSPRIW